MFAVEALRIETNKRHQRALIAMIVIDTSTNRREIRCFIDFEVERNFFSQTFVKKARLLKSDLLSNKVQTMNDRLITFYDSHELNIVLIDEQRVSKKWSIKFHAVNMREYDVILEYSWLQYVNSDIDWRESTWIYRQSLIEHAKHVDIALCTTKEFARLTMLIIEEKSEIYVTILYQLLNSVSTSQLAKSKVARCDAMQIDESDISTQLQNLEEAFFEILSNSLNTHDQMKHFIDLIESKMSRVDLIYNMSQNELAAIREYLASALKKNWIRSFNSLAETSMLFIKKTNDSLRLCVNYRDLNEIIIKNKYSFSLFFETLNRFAHVKRFIKLDIRNVYHRIRIRKNDEWKTTFRTRYDQYEYQMMLFELANAFATFQFYVNEALKSYIDVFCVIYLNDVLIYSKSEKQHWTHVRMILRALFRYRLYAKLSKCAFNRAKITFLKLVIEKNDIQMKQSRIDVIASWFESKFAKNVLIFLSFASFYRRFVKKFSQIVASLIDLIRDAKKSETRSIFAMIKKTKKVFEKLKKIFIIAFVLAHFDFLVELCMKIDASNRDAEDVLDQKSKNEQWHFVVFSSYKFKETECNWDTHDKELYAIVLRFKNWRHYLQNNKHFIRVIIDHNNLRYFMIIKELNARQMRWAKKLVAFDFNIEYRKNKLNSTNASSRRLDLMKSNDSENNNDDFLFILRHKLRSREY